MSAANGEPTPPKAFEASEEAKRQEQDREPLQKFMTLVFGHIPIIKDWFDLEKKKLNLEPRHLYFNVQIPEAEVDSKTGNPKAKYTTNKIRTTKYTPLNFLPKNIAFQFQNVANIYFLAVAILSGFSVFGVNNAGLAAVPIIAIVAITAIRDGIEDWRRMLLDLDMNNTICVVLQNVENINSPLGSISPWRKFKKRCSRFYRQTWYKMRGKQDPLIREDMNDDNENASVRMSMDAAVVGRESNGRQSIGSSLRRRNFSSRNAAAEHLEKQPQFFKKYWKDVKVGDFVKVYADEGVPADLLIISSSDPEGDCFIDTRNLDGETNLKPRRALQMTRNWRRGWQINKQKFELEIEGANSNLDSFGWTYRDVDSGKSEAVGPPNFMPRGSTVRNTRWIIGYVVYTGEESKIRLNAGETPTKRSRISRELNIYVLMSFSYIFILCLVSGIIEGVMFRSKKSSAYYFEFGLTAGHPSVNGLVTFFAAMLVLQNMVPISLYISIEIVRTCLAFFIYSDTYIYDEVVDYPCTPKSWSLSDDLGQIEFIFSDKTGTLTQNSMVFRKCTVNGKSYGTAFTESMAGQVKRQNGDVEAVRAQKDKEVNEERESMLLRLQDYYANPYFSEPELELVSEPIIADLEGNSGAVQRQRLEQFALVLALCNTVVTEYKEVKRPEGEAENGENEDGLAMPPPLMSSEVIGAPSRPSTNSARRSSARSYQNQQAGRPSTSSLRTNWSNALNRATTQNTTRTFRPSKAAALENVSLVLKAESPDESALVKTARDLGYTLIDDGKKHKVIDMRGVPHRFEVLETVLFSSHRKRMSVLVKNEANRYFVLCKGADSVIEQCLSEEARFTELYKHTMHDLQEFGDEGLRTLMVAYRELDGSYAEDWAKRYSDAVTSPERDVLCEHLAEELENDLVLLGGTGIEDQLQSDVPHTIQLLSKAGIKFWMLTGDKVETAISIGFSCNLLNTSLELLIVKHPEELAGRLAEIGLEVNKTTMAEAGADHSPARGKYALVIDGSALAAVVNSEEYRMQFALLGKKCRAVLCCRVSPSQKAAVVHIMKSAFDVTTLAIGDGANDVSMIQEADIGVGIVGVEGRQAAMSADYAMGQFRFLQRLVLVHGRYSYYRIAGLAGNLLYQNFMFSMTLFWYGIFMQFDESYLYDYTYLTLFNSIFVSLPPVIRGILDQDLPDHVLLANPQLYGQGILRKAWTIPKYFLVAVDGIYQSAVAFFFAYSVMFNARFAHMSGRDIEFRQGMGMFIAHTAVFACNFYVMLCQFRWDWFSVLVAILSCSFIFIWTGIYTAFVSSNFFYKTAPHVYSALSFWAYFLLSTVTALLPKFVGESVKAIWFPSDVDIIREEYNYPKQFRKQWEREPEKAEGPFSLAESPGPSHNHHNGHDSHDTTNTFVGEDYYNHDSRSPGSSALKKENLEKNLT